MTMETGVTIMAKAKSHIEVKSWSLDDFHKRFRDKPDRFFALLDACDEPRVLAKVDELGMTRAVSLYRGWAETYYRDIAPYLVQVDEPLIDWIVENIGKDPWGVFVLSKATLPELRRHFRRFLMVEDPDGKQVFFRFYDPRVLSTFLTTSTESEADQFFGPVTAFVATDGVEKMTRFRQKPKG